VPRGGGSRRVGVDHDDRDTDLDRVPLGDEQLGDDARVGRRELDERLGRLDLHDRLVHRDLVTHGDVPLHDLRLGESFAGVRELELLEGGHCLLLG